MSSKTWEWTAIAATAASAQSQRTDEGKAHAEGYMSHTKFLRRVVSSIPVISCRQGVARTRPYGARKNLGRPFMTGPTDERWHELGGKRRMWRRGGRQASLLNPFGKSPN